MEVGRALNKVQSAITGDVLEVWEEPLFQHAGKLGVPLLAVQHLLALVYVRKFPSLQSVRSTTSRGGGISCAVQQQNHPAAHKAACNLVNFLQKLQLSMCLQIRSAALLHSGQRG